MLNENLKQFRKAKGISQEELAHRLNVVRQTVSKWEQGLSVPDCEMLLRLSQELDTPVNILLGETVQKEEDSELKVIAAKLEVLNQEFARRNESRRKFWRAAAIIGVILAAGNLLVGFTSLCSVVSSHHHSTGIIGGADGPTAILVTRTFFLSPVTLVSLLVLVVSIVGICTTRKKNS